MPVIQGDKPKTRMSSHSSFLSGISLLLGFVVTLNDSCAIFNMLLGMIGMLLDNEGIAVDFGCIACSPVVDQLVVADDESVSSVACAMNSLTASQ